MTRVVHVQTHLPSSGNAAYRLHKAMLENEINSTMLSLTSDIPKNEKVGFMRLRAQLKAMLNGRIHSYLTRKNNNEYGLFSIPILGNDISTHEFIHKADVIYLHWFLGGFLNFSSLEKLSKLNKPIIIFMHDMWAITGGCHYSFTCENFKENCNSCQMFPKNQQVNLSLTGFKKKNKIYKKYTNLHFVAPSTWLYKLAIKSSLTKDKPLYHIPNVINHQFFRPFDKGSARKAFSLNNNDVILAFGAASPKSPYKGWNYLKEAMDILSNNPIPLKISIAIFGSDYDEQIDKAIPYKVHFLGRLRDEYSTFMVYNAADVFIAPSVADNLPTTIMESLCCGTPVVAFNTGGIPDMIVHKENGYLAEYRNSKDLANGVKYCIEKKLKGYAPSLFDTTSIIDSHKALYSELIPSKPVF